MSISKIYKDILKPNNKKSNNPIKIEWSIRIDTFLKKIHKYLTKKYMEKGSMSLAIKKMKIKTTMNYYFTANIMAIIKNMIIVCIDKDIDKLDSSYTTGYIEKCSNHTGRHGSSSNG